MPQNITEKIQYYLGTSYRRKKLDKLLNANANVFRGSVLDIGGGRKRGKFVAPKTQKWIFADITPELKPDVICNVEKMQFDDESFDAIKATELFEHVENPEEGIKECYRVLKKGGYFIISMPFLYPIHGDPQDFQRWTEEKWKNVLSQSGFQIEKFEKVGLFFTVLADMLKSLNKCLPTFFRLLGYGLYPLLDFMVFLDRYISKNKILSRYTTGYYIIAKK